MTMNHQTISWAGFHHVALVTPDLDVTIAFYRDVLGMQAGEVLVGGGAIQARHCFVRPGADAATWGLHFFEHPGAELPQFPGGLAGLREAGYIPGALQHIAFALPDLAAADALRARLTAHGIETTPPRAIARSRTCSFSTRTGCSSRRPGHGRRREHRRNPARRPGDDRYTRRDGSAMSSKSSPRPPPACPRARSRWS